MDITRKAVNVRLTEMTKMYLQRAEYYAVPTLRKQLDSVQTAIDMLEASKRQLQMMSDQWYKVFDRNLVTGKHPFMGDLQDECNAKFNSYEDELDLTKHQLLVLLRTLDA